ALELLARVDENARRREEVDRNVVLERRERAHVPSVPLVGGNAPLDRRLGVGDPLCDQRAELLEQRALVGRLLREVGGDRCSTARALTRCARRGFLDGGLLDGGLLRDRLSR